MDICSYNYLIEKKTLWEKKKLLIMSNFFFSRNVFKSCLLLMYQNEYLWSKGLNNEQQRAVTLGGREKQLISSKGNNCENSMNCNQNITLSKTMSGFLLVCSTSLLKTLLEKEKSLVTSNSSFFPSVFYPFGEFSAIFTKIRMFGTA